MPPCTREDAPSVPRGSVCTSCLLWDISKSSSGAELPDPACALLAVPMRLLVPVLNSFLKTTCLPDGFLEGLLAWSFCSLWVLCPDIWLDSLGNGAK